MLNCCIDWLTFTMKYSKNQDMCITFENEIVEKIQHMLVPEGLEYTRASEGWALGHGRFGYKSMFSYEGMEIMFNGNSSICVNITGQGCRAYETFHGSFDNLIYEIVYNKYDVTRLDLAVDDRGEKTILDIKRIYKMSEMMSVRGDRNPDSKIWGEFRTLNRIQGTDGTTIYYGSNNADKRVKIYDKAAEQKMDDENWIRVELTLKNEYAFQALKLIDASVPAGTVFAGVMRNYLFF